MQKYILLIFTLLILPINSMNFLKEIKYFTLQYGIYKLSHQSPEITQMHSQKYLNTIDKTIMKDAICESYVVYNYHKRMLRETGNILDEIDNLIGLKNVFDNELWYRIASAQGNTFAGYETGISNMYANIPIAISHALKTNSFKRILVIDEDVDKITSKRYHKSGNGSLLYNHPNPELFNLFKDKVITYDKIPENTLWKFLHTNGKDIDLAFYHIGDLGCENSERKAHIFSLLQKRIPIIFLVPSDYMDTITNYIHDTAFAIEQLTFPEDFKDFLEIKKDVSEIKNNHQKNDNYDIYHNYTDLLTPLTYENPEKIDNNSFSSDEDLSIKTHDSDSEYWNYSFSDDDEDSPSYDDDPLVFKITTDKNETQCFDGANFMLLAKEININDGIMEITLDDDYKKYSKYQRYEETLPYIVYDINIDTVQPNSFANKLLSEDFPCIGYDKTDQLSHNHTLITQVHSQPYLENINKHPSIMRSAINNNILLSLLPNKWSKPYFTSKLNNCKATLAATKHILNLTKDKQHKHHYAISINEGNSFAGHAEGNDGNTYATIPIAAAYALNTETVKSILVIDENITPETSHDYYNHGNGTIFYPKNNPELTNFFGNKIITHDKLSPNIWDFINDSNNQTDLAFYNINVENNATTEQRKTNILALLKQLIPTVFILSGDKDTYQDEAYKIINDIVKYNEFAKKLRNIDTRFNDLLSTISSQSLSYDDEDESK